MLFVMNVILMMNRGAKKMIRESITKEQYKQIRTRLKSTQAEFATELGIDKQTVSRHETGERGISKTIAILIGYIFEKQK